MMRWPVVLTLGTLVLLCVGGSSRHVAPVQLSPELKLVVDGNSTFAFDLYAKLKGHSGNLVVSPFSISSALAMTYGGARGNTENQMAQALHFPQDLLGFHSNMATITATMTNVAGLVDLQVANGLWPQRDCQLTREFLGLCRQNYHADVDPVDFRTSSESARNRIIAWVERRTQGKIKDLFPPGALNDQTRLVIANAVYFKGQWASQFKKKDTRPGAFWIAPDRSTQVAMMSQKSEFRYLEEGDTQILELPYRDDRISMIVLLPKTRDGLSGLERQLTVENLNQWVGKLFPAEVDLLLPKFKMHFECSLNETLVAMGMSDAFNEGRADFTGMTPQRPFLIGAVAHAALVEVDEEGTVAAAATGVSFGCAERPPPATFHADHPFVFLIRDNLTGTVAFLGRVTAPGA